MTVGNTIIIFGSGSGPNGTDCGFLPQQERFVSRNGVDSLLSTGSADCPFATVTYANARLLSVSPTLSQAPYTLVVGPGVYQENLVLQNNVRYSGFGSLVTLFNGTLTLDPGGSWSGVTGVAWASGMTVLGLHRLAFDSVGSSHGDVWLGPDYVASAYAQINSNYSQPLILISGSATCGFLPPIPPPPPLNGLWCSSSPLNVHFLTDSTVADANPNVPLPAPIPSIRSPSSSTRPSRSSEEWASSSRARTSRPAGSSSTTRWARWPRW